MKLIDSHNIDFNKLKLYFGKKVKLFDVINLINSQPTVYPKESVCSHWIRCWNYKECFICGKDVPLNTDYDFCPHCGRKMKKYI